MGSLFSLLAQTTAQSFPPRSTFNVEDIPDLSGKVMIVTGANSGVGWESAKALLQHNAKVYVAARSPEKADAAIKSLKDATGKDAVYLKLDLADLKAVKAAAEEFLSKESELHALFNNGGVMFPSVDLLTADGYDLTFGTNVLGHFYFTKLLIPALLAGTRTSGDGTVRVVNTSSIVSLIATLDFNSFKDGPQRKRLGTRMLYGQSKAGNVVFAAELARRYGSQGIVSTAVNPGNLRTELGRHLYSVERTLLAILTYPAPMGALTQLYAGTSPEGKDFNGKYLVPWARIGTPRPDSQDEVIGRELWEWMEEQTKDV